MSENNITSKNCSSDCASDQGSLQSEKKEELDAYTVLSQLKNGKSLKDIFQGMSKKRIDEIISQKINKKYSLNENSTLLHYAVFQDKPSAVQDLLNFGADVNAGDEQDRPIHFVESVRVAKLLIEFGVDLQAKRYGDNLLVRSYILNNIDLVRFLLTEKYADSMDIKKKHHFHEKENCSDEIIFRRMINSINDEEDSNYFIDTDSD